MVAKKIEQQLAVKELIRAAVAVGAPCLNREEEFTSSPLPSPQTADRLCSGCPLRGKECRRARMSGAYTYGVLDGRVIDVHDLDSQPDFETKVQGNGAFAS